MNGGYGWAFAPMSWDFPVGSCIVTRLDKKPLLTEHVEVLTECQPGTSVHTVHGELHLT